MSFVLLILLQQVFNLRLLKWKLLAVDDLDSLVYDDAFLFRPMLIREFFTLKLIFLIQKLELSFKSYLFDISLLALPDILIAFLSSVRYSSL